MYALPPPSRCKSSPFCRSSAAAAFCRLRLSPIRAIAAVGPGYAHAWPFGCRSGSFPAGPRLFRNPPGRYADRLRSSREAARKGYVAAVPVDSLYREVLAAAENRPDHRRHAGNRQAARPWTGDSRGSFLLTARLRLCSRALLATRERPCCKASRQRSRFNPSCCSGSCSCWA